MPPGGAGGGGGPAAMGLPIAIFAIAHAAIFAVWIAWVKVTNDAIRDLTRQLSALWARNPELYDLIASGEPIDLVAYRSAGAEMRTDVATALQLCDALGGLAGRLGSDKNTLFSVWPAAKMWASLQPLIEAEREQNQIAHNQFEKGAGLYRRFMGKLTAEARGQSNVVMVTVAVGIAVFVYALDTTIVATALPTIAADLSGIDLYGWVFAAYTIGATATTLLYGRVSDLWNRKTLFVIAMSGFLFGSILCGMAPTMVLLVAARAVQGLFGGATFPLAIGIIADTYPIEKRAQGFAIVPTTFAFASVLGPLFGGFLAQSVGWRAIFFVNIPIVATAIMMLVRSYKPLPRHGTFRFRDLDLLGAVAFFGGIVTILIALTTGHADWDWVSWQEFLLLGIGAALLVIFFYVELHVSRPLLPLRILKHRGLGGALLTIALLGWVTTSMIVFVPQFSQAGLMTTAEGAGIILIPLMFSWSITAQIGVRLGQRYGFRNVALCGVPFLFAGLIWVYFITFGFQGWTIAPGLGLIGIGAGLINPNMLVMAQASLSDQDQGLAGGLGNIALTLSAAVAAASLTAFEVNRLEAITHLVSVENADRLITAQGRAWYAWIFDNLNTAFLQRSFALSVHDVFLVAFIPCILLAFWLGFYVVRKNSELREIRLAPIPRAAPAVRANGSVGGSKSVPHAPAHESPKPVGEPAPG